MKRCPTCQRAFEDDSLTYCLDDGTPLTPEISRPNSQETIVTSPPEPFKGEFSKLATLTPCQARL